jgi:hypothetical protein
VPGTGKEGGTSPAEVSSFLGGTVWTLSCDGDPSPGISIGDSKAQECGSISSQSSCLYRSRRSSDLPFFSRENLMSCAGTLISILQHKTLPPWQTEGQRRQMWFHETDSSSSFHPCNGGKDVLSSQMSLLGVDYSRANTGIGCGVVREPEVHSSAHRGCVRWKSLVLGKKAG